MILYLDSLFLMNLEMNLIVLYLLKHRFGWKSGRGRLLLASLTGAFCYLALFFLPGNVWIFTPFMALVSVFLMIKIMLPKRKRRFLIKAMLWGYGYSFLIAGITRAACKSAAMLSGKEITFLSVVLLGLMCGSFLSWCIRAEKAHRNRHIYQVELESEKGNICIRALLDTGNSLKEPISRRPVCLIEEEILAKLTLENELFLRAVPYHSVGCEQGLLYGVEIPGMKICLEDGEMEVKHVICAGVGHSLSKKGKYQMILHPALLEDCDNG